jgi:hypothetical protein
VQEEVEGQVELTETQNKKRGNTEKAPLASLPFPSLPSDSDDTKDTRERRGEEGGRGRGRGRGRKVGNTIYAMLAKYSPSAWAMVAGLGSRESSDTLRWPSDKPRQQQQQQQPAA